MHYPDGKKIKVGDSVIVEGIHEGRVVISCEDNEYDPGFPKEQWSSLRQGILVVFDNGARMHIPDLNDPGEGPPIIQRVLSK